VQAAEVLEHESWPEHFVEAHSQIGGLEVHLELVKPRAFDVDLVLACLADALLACPNEVGEESASLWR
jgi:hypothetical protein